MPRALWKGAISFGLIYVPVELHTASKENTLPLHMLDSRDFAPVGLHRDKETHSLEVEEPPSSERPKAQMINLMAALKASLAKSKLPKAAKR